MRYPGFVPTINLRLPVLSLTLFAHCYPSQTLLWLKMYQKLFSTHMHNWLLLYICRKNTYQSAVIRSISQCLAPKFASLSQPQKPEVTADHTLCALQRVVYSGWPDTIKDLPKIFVLTGPTAMKSAFLMVSFSKGNKSSYPMQCSIRISLANHSSS